MGGREAPKLSGLSGLLVCLSVSLSLCVCVCVCLSLCLSVSLSLSVSVWRNHHQCTWSASNRTVRSENLRSQNVKQSSRLRGGRQKPMRQAGGESSSCIARAMRPTRALVCACACANTGRQTQTDTDRHRQTHTHTPVQLAPPHHRCAAPGALPIGALVPACT